VTSGGQMTFSGHTAGDNYAGIRGIHGTFVSGDKLPSIFAPVKQKMRTASFEGFRSLIEHSPDAISLIDPQGEVLYASPSTTDVLGYQPEELVGRNGWDLIHPEDRDHSSLMFQQVLSEPSGAIRWHPRIRRKDGTYSWVESTVSNLLIEPDVQAIVVNHRDINARTAVDAGKRLKAAELARSSSEIQQFAYSVVHDLREPLRTISAFTELLVQRIPMGEEDKEIADFIVNGAARMTVLLDDMLAFSSAGAHEAPQRIDLQRAVEAATESLGQAIKGSGAKITVGRLPKVLGNEGQLVRLFQNLIGNAVKYCGPKPPIIYVCAELEGGEWVVEVRDCGLGIAAENQERVFVPFIRLANRDVPGTGLGLAVCRKIVEGMGGKMWVESQLGVGSTFFFTIAVE
jgi:PAS domain S-box-containing protein